MFIKPTGLIRCLMVAVFASLLAACASTPDTAPVDENSSLTDEQAEVQARFHEAVVLQNSGDLDGAKEIYLGLHEANPELAAPLVNLGAIAMAQDKPGDAEVLFEQAVAIDPAQLQSLNALGMLARERGDFDTAESDYRQALENDPDFAPAVLNLAILLDLYRGQLTEALRYYEHYQTIAPEPNPRLKDWIFDIKNRIGE
ncbi:tetratricopeptide repeat protein [Marinobacter sp. 1Y8]